MTPAESLKYHHSGVLKKTATRMGVSKKIAADALIFCFIVSPTIGGFTWLNYKKTIVKKEVKKHIIAGIDKDNLVLFEFSREETQTLLRWEHSREFEYNRNMYDVVETWAVGETIYYRCWWDQEETKLNRQLAELAARAMGKAPQIGEKYEPLISSLKSLCWAFFRDWKISAPEFHDKPSRSFSCLYSSVIIQPPTPPPRLA